MGLQNSTRPDPRTKVWRAEGTASAKGLWQLGAWSRQGQRGLWLGSVGENG